MKQYIRDRLNAIVKLDDPPHRLALAFALGVFIAFSPTLGLHIISCLVVAWVFRLSKFVILTGTLVNNPWTIVPLYGFCIWFGMKITGSAAEVPRIAWSELTFSNTYSVLKPYLWSYVAGTLVLGTIAALLSYVLFYWAILRYRRADKKEAA
jgi:uncharacterized protein (DUF2062 family)